MDEKSNLFLNVSNHISARMRHAPRKQNVNLPEFHGISVDEQDILQQEPPANDVVTYDAVEHLSTLQLATQYINHIRTESFTMDKYIGEMLRKISYHLAKATTTIFKIPRFLFRLVTEKLFYYVNLQEGSRSHTSTLISDEFIDKSNNIISECFERHTRTINVNNQKIVINCLWRSFINVCLSRTIKGTASFKYSIRRWYF